MGLFCSVSVSVWQHMNDWGWIGVGFSLKIEKRKGYVCTVHLS